MFRALCLVSCRHDRIKGSKGKKALIPPADYIMLTLDISFLWNFFSLELMEKGTNGIMARKLYLLDSTKDLVPMYAFSETSQGSFVLIKSYACSAK